MAWSPGRAPLHGPEDAGGHERDDRGQWCVGWPAVAAPISQDRQEKENRLPGIAEAYRARVGDGKAPRWNGPAAVEDLGKLGCSCRAWFPTGGQHGPVCLGQQASGFQDRILSCVLLLPASFEGRACGGTSKMGF